MAGYSPWGHKESDMTEVTYTHACTSCISKRRNEEDVLEFQRLAGRHEPGFQDPSGETPRIAAAVLSEPGSRVRVYAYVG